jgi:hypothetical protein
MLVVSDNDKKALHFHLDLRLSYDQHTIARGLHLLYHRHRSTSYISVFSAAIKDNPFIKLKQVDPNTWKHEVTHDSCWRESTSSVLTENYFEMANEVNQRLGEELAVAPCKMTDSTHFSLFDDAFDWVTVSVTKDLYDGNNYRRLVTVV